MPVSVDIIVKDDSPSEGVISDVVVGIHDYLTRQLLATATTDSSGRAAFLLNGDVDPGQTYEVRFFKQGVLFDNPAFISVKDPLPPGEMNEFTAPGTLLTRPVATDPLLCRCTGRLVDFSNRPLVNAQVRLMAASEHGTQAPKIAMGSLVAKDFMVLRSDKNGWVSADLVRGGTYFFTSASDEDTVLKFNVPDRSSADLFDLIFPRPVSLEWGNIGELSVPSGGQIELPFSVMFSDLSEHDDLVYSWVDFVIDDPNVIVAKVTKTDTLIMDIRALQPGTATIKAILKEDVPPVRLPKPAFFSQDLPVVVT